MKVATYFLGLFFALSLAGCVKSPVSADNAGIAEKEIGAEKRTLTSVGDSVIDSYSSPVSLFDEIRKNKFAFKKNRVGKTVEVSGFIPPRGVDNGSIVLVDDLFSGISGDRVECLVSASVDESTLYELSAGNHISIKGVVNLQEGMFDMIFLKDCTIVRVLDAAPSALLNRLVQENLDRGLDDFQSFSVACLSLGGRVVERGPETICKH